MVSHGLPEGTWPEQINRNRRPARTFHTQEPAASQLIGQFGKGLVPGEFASGLWSSLIWI
jgi:hypothetical protein